MRRGTVIGIAAVAVVIVGIPVWHHAAGARFRSSISPLTTFSPRECRKELYGFGWRSPSFNPVCKHAGDRPAFRISIVNYGHRGAYAQTCQVQSLDRNGAVIGGPVQISLVLATPGVARLGPHLDPGETTMFDWFLPHSLPKPVETYRVACRPVEVRGFQPI